MTPVLLVAIMVSGAFILWNAEQRLPAHRRGRGPDTATFGWLLSAVLLFTVVPLMLTDAFASTWKTVYVGLTTPSVSVTTAMRMMFFADIIAIAILIYQTGGSRTSAFGPVFFIVPALALFLHQSFAQVLVYSGLLFGLFWIQLHSARSPAMDTVEDDESRLRLQRADTLAYWWITFASLMLRTLVAFVADPRWIRAAK